MRKAVTPAQKHEAVSLAAVIGAEAAAKQLGWDPRSIRKWSGQAGKAPADAIAPADWKTLGELARSKVAAMLTTGKLSIRDAATVAGIASRNEREVPPEPEPDETHEWLDALRAALAARYGADVAEDRADELLDELVIDSLRWLHDAPGDADQYAEDPVALVAALPPDWDAWRAEREAKNQADAAAWDARRERSRAAWPHFYRGEITEEQAWAWVRDGIDPFATEDAALIAAAEAFLRSEAA